ncbi:MAG TPA: glycosyltransferase family 9 protein [Bacteroidota bacterium]|jgi:ADP-heptose:LPS heptosyltransferase|nr:glycosyltransferase family 9 protein [Bacteroidota bacterium]
MLLKKVEWTFKKLLMKFLELIIHVKKYDKIDINNSKNILVIRQHNQLGDMLCATPLFRALKEKFPHSRITLVSGIVNTQIVLNNPFLDRVIEYNNVKILRSPLKLINFIRELRKEKYNFVVVPATVSMSVTSDLIAFFSRARYRIGVVSLSGKRNLTGFLYNYPVIINWEKDSLKHQTERNIDVLKDFSISTNDYSLVIGLTDEEILKGKEFYNNYHQKGKISVGIHAGAGKIKNQWPCEKFEELIDKLILEQNCEIFMTIGPMDESVYEYFKDKPQIKFIKGMNVRHVAAILKNLDIFISNDTGIMHLASAVGLPVLSFFGNTDPIQWAPRGKYDKYLLGKDNKIENISVEKAYNTFLKMINDINFLKINNE